MIPRTTRMVFPAPSPAASAQANQTGMTRTRRIDFGEYQAASSTVVAANSNGNDGKVDPTDIPYTQVRRIVRVSAQVSALVSVPVVASSPVRSPVQAPLRTPMRAPIVFSTTHVKVAAGKRTMVCPKAYRDSLLSVAPSEELPQYIPWQGKWRPACPLLSPKSPSAARGSKLPLDFQSRIPRASVTPRKSSVVPASTRGVLSPSNPRAGPPSSSMSLAPFSPRGKSCLAWPTRFGTKGAGLTIVSAKRGGMDDWKSFPMGSSWLNITRAQASVLPPLPGDVPQQSAPVLGEALPTVPSLSFSCHQQEQEQEQAGGSEQLPVQEKGEDLGSEPLLSPGKGAVGDSTALVESVEEPTDPLAVEEEARSEVTTSTSGSSDVTGFSGSSFSSVASGLTSSSGRSSASSISASWDADRVARRREKILALEARIAQRKEMRRKGEKGKMGPLLDSEGRPITEACDHMSCRTEGPCTYKYRDEVVAKPKRLAVELEETYGRHWQTLFNGIVS